MKRTSHRLACLHCIFCLVALLQFCTTVKHTRSSSPGLLLLFVPLSPCTYTLPNQSSDLLDKEQRRPSHIERMRGLGMVGEHHAFVRPGPSSSALALSRLSTLFLASIVCCSPTCVLFCFVLLPRQARLHVHAREQDTRSFRVRTDRAPPPPPRCPLLPGPRWP